MLGLGPVLLAVLSGLTSSSALTVSTHGSPSVVLDRGTFVGKHNGSADAYLGIPYAQPPVGNLRYRQAVANEPYDGVYNVTDFGPACPQAVTPAISGTVPFIGDFETLFDAKFPSISNVGEDCLSINVWTPKDTKPGANLPVVVWLHNGAFVWGGSAQWDGEIIVDRSVQNREPVIFVSLNFRYVYFHMQLTLGSILTSFGFLPGQEAKDAGITNLGLRDQRQAFRWIQQYIHQFGGDHTRVTLWGANAGGISGAFHMLNNNGDTEGLFSGTWMQCGFPLPLNNYTQLQGTYDILVNLTSCKGSSDSLDCLRQLPYDDLAAAMFAIPTDERFGRWQVVIDDEFIVDQPETLLREGRVARVPYVVADTEDEGTQTALNLTAITTDEDVATYLNVDGLPGLPQDQIDLILELYPSDPAAGSPFGTGDLYNITPQYKRMAAIIGDLEFHAQRRFFLNETSHSQPAWSYLSKEFKLPFVGATDLSDLLNLYGPGDLTDYLINFAAHGTPNNGSGFFWPQWTKAEPHQLNIANDSSLSIEPDTFRSEGINLLMALNIQYPE
ncbi:carotenoid ester lipase precursor [Obba rivulosa]|uniref:Carotenoid ester lipase n=1 Tax=Obba rivulosa TaxID=1052685 RepID=A0A8E2AWZ4_9APHY|nr:carotenoid ester lipase precursor [Obba rivulosa]